MRLILIIALCITLIISGCINLGSRYDDFAKCLSQKGIKMYGSKDCTHCSRQKDSFEGAFQYVNYVECSVDGAPGAEAQVCKDAGIQAYPTWVFADNTSVEGEMEFPDLSLKSGCPLPAS
jgi:hypothetical protein